MSDLYEEMCRFENLYEAHRKSRRAKRNREEVICFELDLSENLAVIREQLRNGTYRMGGYRRFIIHDPKEREIHALRYRDRVVQHTLCDNVYAPYFERHLIYDNAASRVGKGTHFAMGRLTEFLREYYRNYGASGYFLKYDVRHYYDSVDHAILYRLIENAFPEEEEILRLTQQIIESYHVAEGKGIPLGNQTSTWYALCYLDGLDRLVKEKLRIKYYTRYMDDGILIHPDRAYLKQCLHGMEEYIHRERKLEFNQKTQIVPLSQGVDYLGFHFYLTDTGKVIRKLRASNKRRVKRKLKRYRHAYREGKIDMDAVTRSLTSYRGHLSHGHTWYLQKNLLGHLILSKDTQKEREEKDEGNFKENARPVPRPGGGRRAGASVGNGDTGGK